jgi:hypothetical protein
MMRFAIAAAGLAAIAGAPALAESGCAPREVSVYFSNDADSLDGFSDELVRRVAAEAKACRSARVQAAAPAGALSDARAETLRRAFESQGLAVALAPADQYAPERETVMDRAAVVRIQPEPAPVG